MAIIFRKLAMPVSVIALIGWLDGLDLNAQNINTMTPFHSVGESFHENFGVNFGFSLPGGRGNGSRIVGLGPHGQLLPNLVFQNTGGVFPRFGGFDPNAGANFGFNNYGSNGSGFSLGLNLSQGSTRTSIMSAPSLTTQNGFGGSMFSGQVRPFVTGTVPILGSGAILPGYSRIYQPDNGVTRAIGSGQLDLNSRSEPEPQQYFSGPVTFSNKNSTATSGDSSVKQIKAERKQRLEAQMRQVESIIAQAADLESQRNFTEARLKYKEALRQTDDAAVTAKIKMLIKATRDK